MQTQCKHCMIVYNHVQQFASSRLCVHAGHFIVALAQPLPTNMVPDAMTHPVVTWLVAVAAPSAPLDSHVPTANVAAQQVKLTQGLNAS